MEIVGQRNRGKEQREDANQPDQALPLATAGGGSPQLREPSQAPYEQKRRGDDEPNRVEEQFHPALILEQAGAVGNSAGRSAGFRVGRRGRGQADFAQGRADSCTPIAPSNRVRQAFRRGMLDAVTLSDRPRKRPWGRRRAVVFSWIAGRHGGDRARWPARVYRRQSMGASRSTTGAAFVRTGSGQGELR